MIEIRYKKGNYSFLHDGCSWEEEDLIDHVSEAGHEREVVGFGVPIEAYEYCSGVAERVRKIFKRRDDRRLGQGELEGSFLNTDGV